MLPPPVLAPDTHLSRRHLYTWNLEASQPRSPGFGPVAVPLTRNENGRANFWFAHFRWKLTVCRWRIPRQAERLVSQRCSRLEAPIAAAVLPEPNLVPSSKALPVCGIAIPEVLGIVGS